MADQTPKKPISDYERCDMMDRFTKGRTQGKPPMQLYREIGAHWNRSPGVIQSVIRRLAPTNRVAGMYMRSKALQMARHVVQKGSPELFVGILSRPGMDVLQPEAKGSGMEGGFQLLVSADTCGAVKVGLQVGQGPQKSLPPAEEESPQLLEETADAEILDAEPVEPAPQPERFFGQRKRTQQTIQELRKRLERRRARLNRHQKERRLQASDGSSET